MICRHCQEDFLAKPGKPGLIDECFRCAVDVPVYRAEAEDATGSSFGLIKTKAQDIRMAHGVHAVALLNTPARSARSERQGYLKPIGGIATPRSSRNIPRNARLELMNQSA